MNLNEGIRAMVHDYGSVADVRLLDLAIVLAEREKWCFDAAHYPFPVSLQLANILLNMLLVTEGYNDVSTRGPVEAV
jgi:hypothetical protein